MKERLEKLKEELLELFPIGSEWYDCRRDQVGAVAFHCPPRGIVLVRRYTATHFPLLPPERQKMTWDRRSRAWVLDAVDRKGEVTKRDHVEITRYSYGDLLDSRLVELARDSDEARELFGGYHKRQEEINAAFDRARLEAGLGEAEIWC